MIKEIYFDSWTDGYFYDKYEINKPYIIYEKNYDTNMYKKYFVIIEKIYNRNVYTKCDFIEWFENLNKEDKLEAVWMMHDEKTNNCS